MRSFWYGYCVIWLARRNIQFAIWNTPKTSPTLHVLLIMCCSRKYPYPSLSCRKKNFHTPPREGFFSLNPQPLQKFHFSVTLSWKKIGLLKLPLPLGIYVNLPLGAWAIGYFLDVHNKKFPHVYDLNPSG